MKGGVLPGMEYGLVQTVVVQAEWNWCLPSSARSRMSEPKQTMGRPFLGPPGLTCQDFGEVMDHGVVLDRGTYNFMKKRGR